ncbi:MAG: T9SS type A sorting domain-containing protein, partial [bacterium]
GGVYCEGMSPIFTHCTFGGNSAGSGGGVYCEGTSPIFNGTTIAFSQGSGIYFKNSAGSRVVYSDIFGNSAGDIVFFNDDPIHGPAAIGQISATNANSDPCDAYYNIFLDPCFVNPPTGDMHVTDSSPCIGAADPTNPPPNDMDGNPRPNPPGSNPDIGAYENAQGTVYPNLGFVTLISPGPTDWAYRLHWISGSLSRLVFTNFCSGTIGSVGGNAEAVGWTVANYSDSIVFTTSTPLASGTIDTFWLSHPYCSDYVTWTAGDSSGMIEGPLPVELTTFQAFASDGQVTLQWRTESELDNSHFVLYKRKVGEEVFRKLTEIPGHGTTTEPHAYEFVDRFVQNGLTYEYRISDVDITGRETIHEQIISATPTRDAVPLEFALHPNFPNPFNPTTTIRCDVKERGLVSLKVFDLLGREVVTLVNGDIPAGTHTIVWDASGLPSGVYLCRMEAERFQETRKMVLLK